MGAAGLGGAGLDASSRVRCLDFGRESCVGEKAGGLHCDSTHGGGGTSAWYADWHEALVRDDIVYSGNDRGELMAWDIRAPVHMTNVVRAHDDSVRSVRCVSATAVVTGSLDGVVKVWDTRTWRCLRTMLRRKPGRTTAPDAAVFAGTNVGVAGGITALHIDGCGILVGTDNGSFISGSPSVSSK